MIITIKKILAGIFIISVGITKVLLGGFISFANWLDCKVDNLIERL